MACPPRCSALHTLRVPRLRARPPGSWKRAGCRAIATQFAGMLIPIHADHRFRFMPITDSDMPITDSDSCRSLWSERVGALDNRL